MESRAAVARVFGVGIRDSMPGNRREHGHVFWSAPPLPCVCVWAEDSRTNQLLEEHLRRYTCHDQALPGTDNDRCEKIRPIDEERSGTLLTVIRQVEERCRKDWTMGG